MGAREKKVRLAPASAEDQTLYFQELWGNLKVLLDTVDFKTGAHKISFEGLATGGMRQTIHEGGEEIFNSAKSQIMYELRKYLKTKSDEFHETHPNAAKVTFEMG